MARVLGKGPSCHLGYDLLEMLTKVNELLVNEANRASLVQVPYLTHTLRAKLYLGEKLLFKGALRLIMTDIKPIDFFSLR